MVMVPCNDTQILHLLHISHHNLVRTLNHCLTLIVTVLRLEFTDNISNPLLGYAFDLILD